MSSFSLRAAVSAPALALAAFSPAFAQEQSVSGAGPFAVPLSAPLADPRASPPAAPLAAEQALDIDPRRDVVVVTGEGPLKEQSPTTHETRTAEEIAETTSVINAEDSLRYFPNILVRKRHIGDTQ